MNKRIYLLGAILLFVVPILAFGATFRVGDNSGIVVTEKIFDDMYIAGGSVSISGAVMGDLYTAGGTVLVNGPVDEDLVAIGGTILVVGEVGDDVRVGGGTVVLMGTVGDDVLIGGGQVTLSGVGIGGDLLIGGGVVRIDTPIEGDVVIGGGEVYLNSIINGNVKAEADLLELGPNAVIVGDFSYRSSKEVVVDEKAQVLGVTSFEPRAKDEKEGNNFAGLISFWILIKTLSVLALALVLGLVFKVYSMNAVKSAVVYPWLNLGRGFALLIILPILSVFFFVTLIGIPFGVLSIFGLVIMIILASAIAPILLGSLLYKWMTKKEEYAISWKTILLGVFAYTILCFIPIVGWIAIVALFLASLGAVVETHWGIVKDWR